MIPVTGVLCDMDLQAEGPSLLDPFKLENVQPASVDLTLDDNFLTPVYPHDAIDLGNLAETGPQYIRWQNNMEFRIKSHEFVLGSTAETINVPAHRVASVEGKSSLARLGLFIHVTAGFIDPGFKGKITLELFNASETTMILRPGMRICQVAFQTLSGAALWPYGSPRLGSHYQGQTETTASRYEP